MRSSEGRPDTPESPEGVADLFRYTVQRLIRDHEEYVLSTSLSPRQNVEVLHLIDENPQPRVRLGYHCVYESFDSLRHITTYGIFLANPWQRPRHEPREESRHYFDAGADLIVVEDYRGGGREFEFLQGNRADAAETRGLEYAKMVSDFESDLIRAQRSRPIRPMSLVFNKFARVK